MALSDYRVGAVTRSSHFVANRIVKELLPGANQIVEYGPGDGVITRAILTLLPPTGKILVVESNPEFVKELQTISDSRLRVVAGLAQEASKDFKVYGINRVEAVFSGIPFSFLSQAIKTQIVEQTYKALEPGGIFLVYQYSTLMVPYLKKKFKKVTVKFELRNLPPYFLMIAEK